MDNTPLHIILADDDEADRLLFTEIFTELNIKTKVITVNNGVELMEMLMDDKALIPHLLFLDLNMPRKNGMQCLREIRSSEKLRHMSVAIYSTSDNESDIEETFVQGANMYITKPSDFDSLRIVLERAVMTTHQYLNSEMKKEIFLLKI